MWSNHFLRSFYYVILGKIFFKIVFKIMTFGFENLNIHGAYGEFLYISVRKNIKKLKDTCKNLIL
jgi:hypothetical protein